METIQVQKNGDVFSCNIGISKEEWLEILKDDKTRQAFKDTLLRFYYMPGHHGSCLAVSNKMGGKTNALNLYVSMFGKYVKNRLNRFEVYGTDGKAICWIIPMGKGRYLSKTEEGAFEWELRPELVEALREYLYWYLVERYKELRREFPISDEGQAWNELYKWELITASIGKTPIEIVGDSVTYPSKAIKGGFENLIDAARDNKTLKYLVENKRKELETVLNNLSDNTQPLNKRLADFKTSMVKLLPSTGYNSKANDERAAATILTCINPDKYTFYKHDELYDRFCKFLGEDMQKAGACYDHYLALLAPLTKLADEDAELQQIIKPMLEGQRQSKLLLAQDILWMLMKGTPQRLGFIYDLLFNPEKKEEMNSENKYIELLKTNKNLILTGAPGTGKTFMAKAIAAVLLGKDSVKDLKDDKHFGFVQFHPSYDYTDFVEGLRPEGQGKGSVGFERKDGVFKEFCKRAALNASANNSSSTTSFNELYERLLEEIRENKIDHFVQRTGAPIFIKEVSSNNNLILIVSKETKELTEQGLLDEDERTYTVSYNRLEKLSKAFPDKKALDSIGNIDKEIRAAIGGCNTSAFWAVLHTLWKLQENYKQPIANDLKPYIFVVDEINRGELSKIFGELFFSIDPGYRGIDGIVKTQYQNLVGEGDLFKDGFYVPENVYIIGTMNDIDRSVESMDFAMRRRFAWQEVTAEESYTNMIENDEEFAFVKDKIKQRMFNLNKAIAETEGLDEAYQIGAAYFRKYLDYQDKENPFECLWNNHLKGLLFEYLRGNRKAKELLEKLHKAYNKTNIDEQPAHTNEG